MMNKQTIDTLLDRAIAAQRANDLDRAERHYRQVLEHDAHNADAWHLLGVLALQRGRIEQAVDHIRHALQRQPGTALFLSNLASALQQAGQWSEAVQTARRAIDLDPGISDAYYTLGISLRRLGQPLAASAAFRKGMLRRVAFPDALCDCAADLLADQRVDEAITLLQGVLKKYPRHGNSWINHGIALEKTGREPEALAAMQRAVALKPDLPAARANLAGLLVKRGDLSEARKQFQAALERDPENARLWTGLAGVDHRLGQLPAAIDGYRAALQRDPDLAVAHYNLGLCLLTLGEWSAGFAEYEWRWLVDNFPSRKCPGPEWDGAPAPDRTILFYAEQGIGDTIQFVRLPPRVKGWFKRVVLACPTELVSLFQRLEGIDEVVDIGQAANHGADRVFPLLGLARVLDLAPESVARDVPYLTIPGFLVDAWRQRLAGLTGLRVGIVWRGNPEHSLDGQRSISPERFQTIGALPGLQLIRLQKNDGPGDGSLSSSLSLHDPGPEWRDWLDTAAVILNLDLVISVDTAVAHLAGALGRPVWTLLPHRPDWRWMLETSTTPWYPTARLFRQPRPGAWDAVFSQLSEALVPLIANRSPTVDHRVDPAPATPAVKTDTGSQPSTDTRNGEPPAEEGSITDLVARADHCFQRQIWPAAARVYRQLAGLAPEERAYWHRLGQALLHQEQYANARTWLEKGLDHHPRDASLNGLHGVALARTGALDEALERFQTAIHHAPDIAEHHFNLGNALRQKNRLEEARKALERAIELNPRSIEFLMALGDVHSRQKSYQSAVGCYLGALAWREGNAAAHANLGLTHKALGQFNRALYHCQRAVLLRPDDPVLRINLGSVYSVMERPREAITCYEKAIYLDASSAMAHVNLAAVHLDMGRSRKAHALLDRALGLDPEYAEAHVHRAFELLREGRWTAGFKAYEWRWKTKRLFMRPFRKPLWDGEPIDGETLLVWAEQGIGDTIQFLRFLPLVRQRVKHLLFMCHAPLVPLLKDWPYLDAIVSFDEPISGFDRHVPLMSLPHRLWTVCPELPAFEPYIGPAPDLVAFWRDRLKHRRGVKIGLAWQGNPQHANDQARSFHVGHFLPLLDLPGTTFIALQIGEALEQLSALPPGLDITPPDPELKHLGQTAALLFNLDLIISADTAVAHLAGALGRPTWIALPFAPDWRWGSEKLAKTWYPTVRPFQQPKPGKWQEVFKEMRNALAVWLSHKRPGEVGEGSG